MAIKAKFILIYGNTLMTKMMQRGQLFEESKVLGEVLEIMVVFKEEETKVTFAQCQRVLDKIASNFPEEFILSLIHLHFIIDDDKILLNTKNKCKPYINKSVRMVSDGEHWGMLHSYLTKLGIEFTLDEYCFVV